MKGLSITPDPRGATALEVTGTIAMTGNPAITGDPAITGALTVSSNLTVTRAGSVGGTITIPGKVVIASAANNSCGRKALSTGGSATVITSRAAANSRVFLTPHSPSRANVVLTIASQTAGSFKVKGAYGLTPTAGTGRFDWLLVNQ